MKFIDKFKRHLGIISIAVIGLPLVAAFTVLVSSDYSKYQVNPIQINEDYEAVFKGERAKEANSYTGEGTNYTADLSYRVNTTDNTACVSAGSANSSATSIVIPQYYSDGTTTFTVIAIDYSAFANNSSLTSVTFENETTANNITIIDAQAFACDTALSSFNSTTSGKIIIPANVTSIMSDTFYSCISLQSIGFDGNLLTSIGSNAFANCSGLSQAPRYKISTSLTIGDSAFANCVSLPSILLPNKVTSIGNMSYYNCKSAKLITIPSSCTSVGKDAFRLCVKAKAYIGSSSRYPSGWPTDSADSGSDVIGTGSVTESDWNYANNAKAIPITTNADNVTTEGYYTYSSTWDTDLGLYLITIIEYSDEDLTVQTSVSVPQTLPVEGDGEHYNTNMNYDGNQYGIVYNIGSSAFYSNTNITSLTFPNTLNEISTNAVYGCSNITTLTLSDKKDDSTIYFDTDDTTNTTDMNTLNLEGLKYIDKLAFSSLELDTSSAYASFTSSAVTTPTTPLLNISTLTIPSTVVTISEGAFFGLINLKTLSLSDCTSLVTIGNNAFACAGSNLSSTNCGQSALVLPSTITTIGSKAFYNARCLQSLIITDTTTSGSGTIGESAFSYCEYMRFVDIGKSIKYINNNYSFSYNSRLEWAYISSNSTRDNINNNTFLGGYTTVVYLGTSSGSTKYFYCDSNNYLYVTNEKSSLSMNSGYLPYYSGVSGVYPYNGVTTKATGYVITDLDLGIQYYKSGSSVILTKYLNYIGKTSIDLSSSTSTNGWSITKIATIAFCSVNTKNSYISAPAITTLILPNTVSSIDKMAFFGCKYLTELTNSTTSATYTFPTSLTSIGDYAFVHTNLVKAYLPTGISSIGSYAFSYIPNLTKLNIPSSSSSSYYTDQTDVGVGALYQKTTSNSVSYYHLVSVTGPSVATYAILDGTTTIDSNAVFSSKVVAYTIPNSVTTISDYGFGMYLYTGGTSDFINDIRNGSTKLNGNYYVSYTTSISLVSSTSSKLTYIGTYAFTNQTSITTFVFPNNSSSSYLKVYCGNYAFRACKSLTGVTFPDDNHYLHNDSSFLTSSTAPTYYTLAEYIFDQCDVIGSSSTEADPFVFPKCITKIGQIAFWGARNLHAIRFDGIKDIGGQAFQGCSGLTKVDFNQDASVTFIIESQAFVTCTSLSKINLAGKGVTSIGNLAFSGCTSLPSIDLASCASLTTIGNNAFSSCNNISYIDLSNCSALTTIGTNAFSSCGTSKTNVTTTLSGCGALTTIGASAFESNTKTISYNFTSCTALTTINSSAFKSNSALTSLDLSPCTALITIGSEICKSDSNMTSVTFPTTTTLTTIENNAFNATGLTTVDLSVCSNLSTLGSSIFSSCTSLATAKMSTGMTTISQTMFSGCVKLTTITNMTNVTKFNSNCFSGCTLLKETTSGSSVFTIPTSLTTIGDYAFYYCQALVSINFGSGTALTSIGTGAFSGCSALSTSSPTTSITGSTASVFVLPAGLTSIGGQAFRGCTSLQALYLPASLTKVGTNLVYATSSSLRVYVGITYGTFLNNKADDKWISTWYNISSGIAAVYYYSASTPTTEERSFITNGSVYGYWYGSLAAGLTNWA